MNILSPFIKLAAPTLIRHGIAAAGGYLACNAASLFDLIAGAVMFAIPVVWSYLTHTKLSGEQESQAKLLARAVASQAVAAISGALVNHGFTGDPNDTAAVMIFGANYAQSLSAKRKADQQSQISNSR